jgi:hypothetical protein
MYGISRDTNLDFLCGRELIQVLVGQYQVILRFDAETTISVEGEFDHVVNGKSQLVDRSLPMSAASLLRLIAKKVDKVEILAMSSVRIGFSNGDQVFLKDSNQGTESFEINAPGTDIVV